MAKLQETRNKLSRLRAEADDLKARFQAVGMAIEYCLDDLRAINDEIDRVSRR